MLFISPYKLFSFSRYLNFCLYVLIKWKKGLIRKVRLTSKFMTSQLGKQTIAIHILPNISKNERQSDNEIWSVNRIEHEKYFS